MEEFFLKLFDQTSTSAVSTFHHNGINLESARDWLKNTMGTQPLSSLDHVHSLLDEINNANRPIHQKNQEIVDEYNRSAFRCLQDLYGCVSEDNTENDPPSLASLRSLKAQTLEKLTPPTLSATQIYMLNVLCQQATTNALACLDNSYQDVRKEESRNKAERICRIFRMSEFELSSSNPLLSVFPDKVKLNQAIRRLRRENLFFMYAAYQSTDLPIFTVPSQASKRRKSAKRQQLDTAIGPEKNNCYTCIGGYHCNCEAFYNKVLAGTYSMGGHKGESPKRSFSSEHRPFIHRHTSFCKHSLAAQLILACEQYQPSNHFDIRCFFAYCIENLNEPFTENYRLCPSVSFYCDLIAVTDERYMELFILK